MRTRHFAPVLLLTMLAGNRIFAQPLSLDPPSEVGAEIKRTEAAWSAWRISANPKLEQTILTNPNALADIARDEQGAVQYLEARHRLFDKIAKAFSDQIESLRTATPQWDSAVPPEQIERRKLNDLLAMEERLLASPPASVSDPAKQLLLREQRERDLKTIADLKVNVRHRLEMLEALAGDERASAKQAEALLSTLEQVRNHFRDLADETDAERSEWQDYFDGLRQIAIRSGVARQGKGTGKDDGSARPRTNK